MQNPRYSRQWELAGGIDNRQVVGTANAAKDGVQHPWPDSSEYGCDAVLRDHACDRLSDFLPPPRPPPHYVQGRESRRVDTYGFTYIGLLIAIVVAGIGLAAVGPVSHTLQMRDKERELLFAGDQIRRAIGQYYEKSPGGLKQFPKKLEDLLRDNRYPNVQRWLRRIYVDPMTAKTAWGLVELPGVGITGVYSLSEVAPLRTANFPALYKSFETAKKYSDWKFIYAPGQIAGQTGVTPTPIQNPFAPQPSVPNPAAPQPNVPNPFAPVR